MIGKTWFQKVNKIYWGIFFQIIFSTIFQGGPCKLKSN